MAQEKDRTRKRKKSQTEQPNQQQASLPKTEADEDIVLSSEQPEIAPTFPIVGIGASAGGLAAFEAFFSGLPADVDPNMAFVLVQHLAPDHESILTELIRRYTSMTVFEVEDGMVVRPNCAYIIPPNRDMAFLNGTLQLMEPSAPRGQRLPIDFFFRSLAQDQHERAICIVLSGTGSDGTLGVRDVKGEGGMVMAQTPASTEHDGMPRNAIATGLVDFELPPAEMGAQLMTYVGHAFGKLPPSVAVPMPDTQNMLRKIFILLRAQTGHDFSLYKVSTIDRRIKRRMAVHQIDRIGSYVKLLRQSPTEVDALFRDMLIGVTSFFRDPDLFQTLEEKLIPKLLSGKPAGSLIRVWCAGCSTGEEAYSMAILLQEHLEALKLGHRVQIFATDIDSQSIASARAGIYPASIAVDVSPSRLARFFIAEQDGSSYRISKAIRDMLVFSEQDVIKDPPFSRLDLITCRNLLIYMGGKLQKKLIPLFHYALNPTGFLFLGSSETVGDAGDLFSTLDRKARLYQRKNAIQTEHRATFGQFLPPLTSIRDEDVPDDLATSKLGQLPLRDLTEQALLQQLVPAGALVDELGNILYVHGRTGLFLELPPGETGGSSNILKMSRDELRQPLTTALHKSKLGGVVVRCPGVRVKTNGGFTTVNLTVCPVASRLTTPTMASAYLVILEKVHVVDDTMISPPPRMIEEDGSGSDVDVRIAALKQELRAKEEYIQTTTEELETSNEELKSSNEEMQSVNEELQSTNEELETSKEELQSLNEELATVNAELQNKVTDLSQANNDMNNLLAGTGIGTIFVDHQLRILRFTPTATHIINLIRSDVGRPVGHIVSNLVDYDSLVADVKAVLDSLVPKEMDVQSADGAWYSLHIQPYRTLDNVIEGAVLTFFNISRAKGAQDALEKANDLLRLAVVVRDSNDAVLAHELDGTFLAWNPAAERMYGWRESEALAMSVFDMVPEEQRADEVARVRKLSQGVALDPYRTEKISKSGARVTVLATSSALINEKGQIYAIATTERMIKAGEGESSHA